jgi:hypothetical protein
MPITQNRIIIEWLNNLPERFKIILIIIPVLVYLLKLLHFIIYPSTLRLNFRERKRRDRIEHIVKMLERQAMLEDTNIAVLKEELNRLVFEDMSGIAAKSLTRNSLKNLYDAAPSKSRWPSIKAAYSSFAEQDGKLTKRVSIGESIFGIAFIASGAGTVLMGLFVCLYTFALRSQLSARVVFLNIILGLCFTTGGILISFTAIPVIRAWQLKKWIPEKYKAENDKQMSLPFDQQPLPSHLMQSVEKGISEVRNKADVWSRLRNWLFRWNAKENKKNKEDKI